MDPNGGTRTAGGRASVLASGPAGGPALPHPLRVTVFASAGPESFLAHVDLHVGEQTDDLAEVAAVGTAGIGRVEH